MRGGMRRVRVARGVREDRPRALFSGAAGEEEVMLMLIGCVGLVFFFIISRLPLVWALVISGWSFLFGVLQGHGGVK